MLNLELQALSRFYVAHDPKYAERCWRAQINHDALEKSGQRNVWFRSEDGYVIFVDDDGNGLSAPKLPDSIPPEMVVDIPSVAPETPVLDRIRQLALTNTDDTTDILIHTERLHKLSMPENPYWALLKATGAVHWPDPFQTTTEIVDNLLYRANKIPVFMALGEMTGVEASGLITIKHVLDCLLDPTANFTEQDIGAALRSAFDAPTTSTEELGSRLLAVLWILSPRAAYRVGDKMRRAADNSLLSARNMASDNRPVMRMFLPYVMELVEDYRNAIFAAIPTLMATLGAYEKFMLVDTLTDTERLRFKQQAHNLDEKLVRVVYALQYAIGDHDGRKLNHTHQEVNDLMVTGLTDDANALVMDTVDLNIFYPRFVKDYLQAGALQVAH